ncbi:MAG: hypothetical protein RBR97_11970 [Bacteroidales bacterium]|jgi:hypothetical protein|nr:hypothetical protein [Bacteroidales bacterium]
MKHSIFLSYPKPFTIEQSQFINDLVVDLSERGFEPRTLGVSDYDMDEPLVAIRRLMLESYGIITIAFRRTYINEGCSKPNSDNARNLSNVWFSSAYCQIEPAMAFQIGLPIMVLRESGVVADGILEKGVAGLYLPEFDLYSNQDYLKSHEWKQLFNQWSSNVLQIVKSRGYPKYIY